LPEQVLEAETADQVAWNNLRVLVVDDCFTSRKFATKYLGSMGCLVEEACDGREALAAIKAGIKMGSPFNLILTDYRMPNMNGYDLARNVRQLDGNQRTPIIAVTGLQEIVEIGNLQDLGFDQCLAKPLKIDELKLAMIAVCDLSQSDIADVEKTNPSDREPVGKRRRKGRILLVEDYTANQQVAIMHLTSAGYHVDLAQNGLQAVEKFSQEDYDLILMDLEMPGMDGYSATREIRCIEAGRHTTNAAKTRATIPIIAITAHALVGYEEKCSAAGMNDFMTKPLRRAQLLAKVRHWLSCSGPGALVETTHPLDNLTAVQIEASADQAYAQPIDMQKALEEFLGEQEILDNVLRSFQSKVQEQIHLIEHALKTNDAETVRKEAHAIKGGAANLTAQPLADIALSLENIGKSGCLDNGAARLLDLENELNRLDSFCANGMRFVNTTGEDSCGF
jgi:two-component system sensor histidine kinase/response regulator